MQLKPCRKGTHHVVIYHYLVCLACWQFSQQPTSSHTRMYMLLPVVANKPSVCPPAANMARCVSPWQGFGGLHSYGEERLGRVPQPGEGQQPVLPGTSSAACRLMISWLPPWYRRLTSCRTVGENLEVFQPYLTTIL